MNFGLTSVIMAMSVSFSYIKCCNSSSLFVSVSTFVYTNCNSLACALVLCPAGCQLCVGGGPCCGLSCAALLPVVGACCLMGSGPLLLSAQEVQLSLYRLPLGVTHNGCAGL